MDESTVHMRRDILRRGRYLMNKARDSVILVEGTTIKTHDKADAAEGVLVFLH